MSDLTVADFVIGICRACGRYGQLCADRRVCAFAAEPPELVGEADEHWRPFRACRRRGAA